MSRPWKAPPFFVPERLDHIAYLHRLSPFDPRWVTMVCTGHHNLDLAREDLSWTLGGVPNPHLDKLMVLLTRAVSHVGRYLAGGGAATDEQLEIYVGGALYCLWIETAPRVQALIDDDAVHVPWFEAFVTRYRALFGYKGITLPDPGHLLALFYQWRRAWYYPATLLAGRSPCAQAARHAVFRAGILGETCHYAGSLYATLHTVPVLITGETGTGKEIAAKSVARSRYIPFNPRTKRFARKHTEDYHIQNLVAVPHELLASTLFGHTKGSYTGANDDAPGLFGLLTEGVVLCFDEIGELPSWAQAMLLRPLQSRDYLRVGEQVARSFDGRPIFSTNRDLEAMVREGKFRADLLERMNLARIHLPSLRQRYQESPDELVHCVRTFVQKVYHTPAEVESWTARVVEALYKDWQTFPWDRNLRALENYTKRFIFDADGKAAPEPAPPPPVERRHDTEPPPNTRAAVTVAVPSSGMIGPEAKKGNVSAKRVLRSYLKHLLERNGGSVAKTARDAQMDPRAVRKILELTPKPRPKSKKRLKPKPKPEPKPESKPKPEGEPEPES